MCALGTDQRQIEAYASQLAARQAFAQDGQLLDAYGVLHRSTPAGSIGQHALLISICAHSQNRIHWEEFLLHFFLILVERLSGHPQRRTSRGARSVRQALAAEIADVGIATGLAAHRRGEAKLGNTAVSIAERVFQIRRARDREMSRRDASGFLNAEHRKVRQRERAAASAGKNRWLA